MNLYVNGCSFTHGHKDWDDNKSPPKWVWPSLLENYFDEVINNAWQGGSNYRIVRKTLEFFDKRKDCSEWIAIIQWTDPFGRMELYDEETDTYFGYMPGCQTPILYGPDHNKFITIPDKIFRMVSIYEKSTIVRSRKILESAFVQQQFLLSEYFKRKNIKFLYTAMNSSSKVHPETSHPLTQFLPYENMTTTFSSFVNPNTPNLIESSKDFHPNKDGHAVIANYITNELKARNYL